MDDFNPQPFELTASQLRRIQHLVDVYEGLEAEGIGRAGQRHQLITDIGQQKQILAHAMASLGERPPDGSGRPLWDRHDAIRYAAEAREQIAQMQRRLDSSHDADGARMTAGVFRPLLSELRAKLPQRYDGLFPDTVPRSSMWQPPAGKPAARPSMTPRAAPEPPEGRQAVQRVARPKSQPAPTEAQAAQYAESRSQSPFPNLPGPGQGVL